MFRIIVIKFFPFLYLALSILILIYVFHKDQFIYEGNKFEYYKIYYIIIVLNLIFSITIILINKIRIYFFIILLSVFFSIYLFEIYLNILKLNSVDLEYKIKEYKKIYNKDYDTRSKSEIYKDLSLENKNVSIAIFPSLFLNQQIDLYPLSGISNSKTIYDNENGYYFIYDSDRFGFNNPDTIWDEDEIDYILVGDSFIHGASVNPPFDIASILREKTNHKILNLSYGGNGPLLQLATLKEYLPKKVNNIIWFYYEGNDNYDLNNELKNNKLLNYLSDENFNQNLRYKQNTVDIILKDFLNLELNSQIKKNEDNLIDIIKLNKLRKILHKKEIHNSFESIINKVKKISSEKNANLYFVYLPEHARYKLKFYNDENRKNVISLIKNLNINIIDIHQEVFLKSQDPLDFFPFRMYGHYNEKGYKIISNSLYNLLTN